MLAMGYFWQIPFLGSPLVFMCLYIWSRKQPHRPINFWGFGFEAWHLPFVLLLFGVIMGASPVLDIMGITVGHLYHFLKDIVPHVYHVSLLNTPQFVYRIFEEQPNR